MKRRRLLQGAAFSAASAAVARRTFGANARLGVALVGAGSRGVHVAKALVSTGQAEITAICDVYDARRAAARTSLAPDGRSVPEGAAAEELIRRSDVDAVLVATPDHLHLPLAQLTLKAGKHLFLEKPSVHRWEETAPLLAAVRASGKVCQTGTQQRSGAHYKRARAEVLATGRLGKVLFVRAVWADFPRQRRTLEAGAKPDGLDWDRFLGPAPRVAYHPARYEVWRTFPEYGGGLLADIFTHWADVAQWMMNDAQPLAATAMGGVFALGDGRKNPDTVNALVRYRDWNLTFESSVMPAKLGPPSVTFVGTEGTLEISRSGYVFQVGQVAKDPAQRVSAEGDLDQAHARDFIAAVRSGAKPSADVEVGVEALRPVHLALASYRTGQTMSFTADGRRIVGRR